MPIKRIIPCLDVKDGRVVKGISFVDLKDAGDPVELARYYANNGADELVLLDISATTEGRRTMLDLVQEVAKSIQIPLIVGGGMNSIEDMKRVLEAGATKVSLNTAIVDKPNLISEAVQIFGEKSLVAAIDARFNEAWNTWEVYTRGGTKATGLKVLDWAQEVAQKGAAEILLTSMDRDGHKDGYDLLLTNEVAQGVSIPVIASGGAGSKEDFEAVFTQTSAAAALAASIFHYQETSISEIKNYLANKGVKVEWKRK